ncbi:GNAT family N-acetyltransferase [Deinococcus sonorensis]|uniref:GNAT family N-acetyltransferase n=2 Tax=Deinococcus sonorensis TaxID=309891 RepID=A0AAU7U929_9DEIO
MDVTARLDGTLLEQREQEWQHWLAHPDENPLSTRADFTDGEVLLENDLCVYTQDARYSDGLPYAGLIVTRTPRQTVFDLTPEEVLATHRLLAEVREHLQATVQPDGYTIGWNVCPAGGAHIPHVHLHVIPRWNHELAAGAGLRHFLKLAARQLSIRAADAPDLPTIHRLILDTGLSHDPALITATLEASRYWLAELDGQVAGCIGLEHGEGASLLRSACVASGRQGQGVGARLARVALAAARKRGDRAVYLFSSHAGGYWQRLGFVAVPPQEVADRLPTAPQVRSGECRGWLHTEQAWKLDLSG